MGSSKLAGESLNHGIKGCEGCEVCYRGLDLSKKVLQVSVGQLAAKLQAVKVGE